MMMGAVTEEIQLKKNNPKMTFNGEGSFHCLSFSSPRFSLPHQAGGDTDFGVKQWKKVSCQEGVSKQVGGDCSWHRPKTLLGKRPTHVENRKDHQGLDPQRVGKLESGATSSWCNRPDNEERELQ